jgi:hypothetical protein
MTMLNRWTARNTYLGSTVPGTQKNTYALRFYMDEETDALHFRLIGPGKNCLTFASIGIYYNDVAKTWLTLGLTAKELSCCCP